MLLMSIIVYKNETNLRSFDLKKGLQIEQHAHIFTTVQDCKFSLGSAMASPSFALSFSFLCCYDATMYSLWLLNVVQLPADSIYCVNRISYCRICRSPEGIERVSRFDFRILCSFRSFELALCQAVHVTEVLPERARMLARNLNGPKTRFLNKWYKCIGGNLLNFGSVKGASYCPHPVFDQLTLLFSQC